MNTDEHGIELPEGEYQIEEGELTPPSAVRPYRARVRPMKRVDALGDEPEREELPPNRNVHCSNCGDTRGGPVGHEISECTW